MKDSFANPIYGGQDPFVTLADNGKYYFVAEATGSRAIEVYESDRLTDRGVRHVVFTAHESGPSSYDLWAPELWHLRGKWYIYYAGASGAGIEYWNTHRMYVLEADHPLGPYREAGELQLGEYMSIDGTVLELPNGDLYFVYMRKADERLRLFIAPMDSPTHISGEPQLLSEPEYPWEEVINEGPFPIVRDGSVRIMYSANAAHLPQYCLGLLTCEDVEHILCRSAWKKEKEPIFRAKGKVYGPGHACISCSPDRSTSYLMYHSKFDLDVSLPGGWNRVVNITPITWQNGRPVLGDPPQPGEEMMLPSGEKPFKNGEKLTLELAEAEDLFAPYAYFREQTIAFRSDALEIWGDIRPDFGDKLILRDRVYGDFQASIGFEAKSGEAAFLFHVHDPAVGRANFKGIAALSDGHEMKLCSCDGEAFRILARACATDPIMSMEVKAVGTRVELRGGNAVIQAELPEEDGFVGVAAYDGKVRFYTLSVDPISVNDWDK